MKEGASYLNEFFLNIDKQAVKEQKFNIKMGYPNISFSQARCDFLLASSEVKSLARLKMETGSEGSYAASVSTIKNFSSSVSEEKEKGDKKG